MTMMKLLLLPTAGLAVLVGCGGSTPMSNATAQQLSSTCLPHDAATLTRLAEPTEPAQQARGKLITCLGISQGNVTAFELAFDTTLTKLVDSGKVTDRGQRDAFVNSQVPGLILKYH